MDTADALLKGLNSGQQAAVVATEGPVLILAGPGSGKTRVITHRVAYLLRQRNVRPWNILAVTFTNKAARSMKERLEVLAPYDVPKLTIGTFHAICARILRRDGEAIGIGKNFTIYDDGDQVSVVKSILKEFNLDEKQFGPRSILSRISGAKSELREPRVFAEFANTYIDEVVGRIYRRYQELLGSSNAVDFDDLLMSTMRLLREHPDILDMYQERYRYLMVDEFQDTNVAQYSIVKQLAAKYRNICVVGDEDQSIYSWRGANFRNVLNFEKDHPGARVILLEQNYRSTGTILEAARKVIANNTMRKEKNLFTENGTGDQIRVYEAYNEDEEASFVAAEIERAVSRGDYNFRDFSVLYRTNAQSRALEKVLVRRRIPHRVVGTRFYDRKEVKDILSYLRVVFNPDDNQAMQRILNVPPRGVGAKTIAEFDRWSRSLKLSWFASLQRLRDGDGLALIDGRPALSAKVTSTLTHFQELLERLIVSSREMPVVALISQVMELTDYRGYLLDGNDDGEERVLNVQELATVALPYTELEPPAGLAAFLEETALVADVDGYDETNNAVSMITFHAAKGLEFPVVFMVGMEEGICPHSRSLENEDQMEEERRLAYVGITRARERLYMVYAFRRSLFGSGMNNTPSRFIDDIPARLKSGQRPGVAVTAGGRRSAVHVEPAGQPNPALTWDRGAPAEKSHDLNYVPGDRVRHPKFGEGIVVDSTRANGDEEVTVAFQGIGVKKLAMSFASLQRL